MRRSIAQVSETFQPRHLTMDSVNGAAVGGSIAQVQRDIHPVAIGACGDPDCRKIDFDASRAERCDLRRAGIQPTHVRNCWYEVCFARRMTNYAAGTKLSELRLDDAPSYGDAPIRARP